MEINDYALTLLANERLAAAREAAARRALVAACAPPRVPLRIRLGRRLLAAPAPQRATP